MDDADVADQPGLHRETICLSPYRTPGRNGRDTLARAFEPFFTTKEVGKGSGLGSAWSTASSSSRADTSGSNPSLVGERPSGSILPRAADGAALASQEVRDGALPRGSEKILLVEDDALVREIGDDALGNLGYRVVSAAGASEALGVLNAERDSIYCSPTSLCRAALTARARRRGAQNMPRPARHIHVGIRGERRRPRWSASITASIS